jgi:hypothetical protein
MELDDVDDPQYGETCVYLCICSRCGKKRTVPDNEVHTIDPITWQCNQNHSDSNYASCDQVEQVVDVDESLQYIISATAADDFGTTEKVQADTATAGETNTQSAVDAKDELVTARELVDALADCVNSITWWRLWVFIRAAPTIPQCIARLNTMKTRFPRSKSYLLYLTRNVSMWALCAFTWVRTYGFEATSLLEALNGHLKRYLRHQKVPLHAIFPIIDKMMDTRMINQAAKKSNIKTVNQLEDACTNMGMAKACRAAAQVLTDVGQSLFKKQIAESVKYSVTRLNNIADVKTCLAKCTAHYGPSARRFQCIID